MVKSQHLTDVFQLDFDMPQMMTTASSAMTQAHF